jgi:hypothetical protein
MTPLISELLEYKQAWFLIIISSDLLFLITQKLLLWENANISCECLVQDDTYACDLMRLNAS